jgi:hypothetical protein
MKKLIIALSCCTAFLLVAYVGYRGYKVWKREHLISMARGFIAKSDEPNALLSLRQVLSSNPRNLEATRLMADLATKTRSSSALQWRNRAVELNPNSAQDRLALAQTALMFNEFATATNALLAIADADRNTADYHNAAGTAAVGLRQLDEAERHFSQAARLAPTDPVSLANLQVVRIHGTNIAVVEQARSALQGIAASTTNSQVRCQALRQLIRDAARFTQTNAALSLSEELLRETNSGFADRLVRLNALRWAQPNEFKIALSKVQEHAATDPVEAFELGSWQNTILSDPAGTLTWINSLSTNVQSNLNIAILCADSYTMLADWHGLQSAIQGQNWHEMDFMRHALMSLALRRQNLSASAKTEWEQAAKSANSQMATLAPLLRFATQWKWEDEAEQLLWVIVDRYPKETWAAKTLTQVLFATGRTRPLMMLFSQELKSAPSNLDIKNNLATIALLLEANELKPHDLARAVYQSAPTNASYVSTYAFSLYLQKRPSEALKVIEQLTPQQLEKPSISGYYGLILRASGNVSKAKPYLDAATDPKTILLPEERKLFDQAKAGA